MFCCEVSTEGIEGSGNGWWPVIDNVLPRDYLHKKFSIKYENREKRKACETSSGGSLNS